MRTARRQHRSPLDLFPDKSGLRLYEPIVEVLKARYHNRRAKEAYSVANQDHPL